MSANTVNASDIEQAVNVSGIEGFTGDYRELGGGEVNDTFVLDCTNSKVVLRIARYDDVRILNQEARALGLLSLSQVPKLIYYDESQLIRGRAWIAESYVEGLPTNGLTTEQLRNLGGLMAQVHEVSSNEPSKLDLWSNFVDACKHFGDESSLLSHQDGQMQTLIQKGRDFFLSQQFEGVTPVLIHGDVTLSNMLVNGNSVSLIDWEFSKFKDPMADFSTMFYDDMDYNNGKWRIHVKPDEKAALFDGYTRMGGVIDEQRLSAWQTLDKLGAAVYLYWKINQAGHDITDEQAAQYRVDLTNLTQSLQQKLS